MFKKLFTSKTPPTRHLEKPEQLDVGDIVTFKYRDELPPVLREKSLEVTGVAAYEYSDYVCKEIQIKDDFGNIFFMAFNHDDGKETLCISVKIPRSAVLVLFDDACFSGLWEEDFAELTVKNDVLALEGWYGSEYRQSVKSQQVYYYDKNPSDVDIKSATDGEELRYHECEGDDHYGLGVEVWTDGSTDVFLQVICSENVIEALFPHG